MHDGDSWTSRCVSVPHAELACEWLNGEEGFAGVQGRTALLALVREHAGQAAAGGYAGARSQWAREQAGLLLAVVCPWWRQVKCYLPDLLDEFACRPGFNVIPRRGGVERTIASLGRFRRINRDYERLPTSSEALIHVSSIRLLLVRLA